MALPDPTTITIDGTARTLARLLTGTSQGRFVSADGRTELTVTPSTSATKKRTSVRLVERKIASDPLVSTINRVVEETITINFSRDKDGYTDADVAKALAGLVALVTTASYRDKVLAGEN